jgi:hypothetical protein
MPTQVSDTSISHRGGHLGHKRRPWDREPIASPSLPLTAFEAKRFRVIQTPADTGALVVEHAGRYKATVVSFARTDDSPALKKRLIRPDPEALPQWITIDPTADSAVPDLDTELTDTCSSDEETQRDLSSIVQDLAKVVCDPDADDDETVSLSSDSSIEIDMEIQYLEAVVSGLSQIDASLLLPLTMPAVLTDDDDEHDEDDPLCVVRAIGVARRLSEASAFIDLDSSDTANELLFPKAPGVTLLQPPLLKELVVHVPVAAAVRVSTVFAPSCILTPPTMPVVLPPSAESAFSSVEDVVNDLSGLLVAVQGYMSGL